MPTKSRSFIPHPLLWLAAYHFTTAVAALSTRQANGTTSLCGQPAVLIPSNNEATWTSVNTVISTQEFGAQAAQWLGGAVQIPTISFDDMGPVGEDTRWENRAELANYLVTAFPRIHAAVTVEKVNTYGLLYTWQGSNSELKPLLLLAHQDVVPINPATESQWIHPPFAGHFDGKKIWGRGSIDNKSGVIGTLAALELLIEHGFTQPQRTILLSFGFDEEIGGQLGAHTLSEHLLQKYGKDSVALVVDEGSGFGQQFGGTFASVGVAEKGSLTLRVEVATPGGHASVPPPHTGIGILSSVIVEFENNPFEVHLSRSSPTYQGFQCVAEHGSAVPEQLRQLIIASSQDDNALRQLEQVLLSDSSLKSQVSTTQAADIIGGGVKSNALPELSWAVVDHRIAIDSSVNATQERDIRLVAPLATRFNLTFSAFGVNISEGNKGHITLSTQHPLDSAPLTPVEGAAYKVLSGTIKAAFNAHRSFTGNDSEIVVIPGVPSANTDTRWYWDLTPNIFRYGHLNVGVVGDNPLASGGIHGVNEGIDLDVFLEVIRFYTTLILNVEEATGI